MGHRFTKEELIIMTDEMHDQILLLLKHGDNQQGHFDALTLKSMDVLRLQKLWIKLGQQIRQTAGTYSYKAMTARKATIAEELKQDKGVSHGRAYETAASSEEYRTAIMHKAKVDADLVEAEEYLELTKNFLRVIQMKLSSFKNKV